LSVDIRLSLGLVSRETPFAHTPFAQTAIIAVQWLYLIERELLGLKKGQEMMLRRVF
jgi:hypothetical protein